MSDLISRDRSDSRSGDVEKSDAAAVESPAPGPTGTFYVLNLVRVR